MEGRKPWMECSKMDPRKLLTFFMIILLCNTVNWIRVWNRKNASENMVRSVLRIMAILKKSNFHHINCERNDPPMDLNFSFSSGWYFS
jgi:hypothetical protein